MADCLLGVKGGHLFLLAHTASACMPGALCAQVEFGDWLNVWITVERPLKLPVGGLLGPGYVSSLAKTRGPAGSASTPGQSGDVAAAAALPLMEAAITSADM